MPPMVVMPGEQGIVKSQPRLLRRAPVMNTGDRQSTTTKGRRKEEEEEERRVSAFHHSQIARQEKRTHIWINCHDQVANLQGS